MPNVPFGVVKDVTPQTLPDAFATLPARFLPELDRQLTILTAAHTAVKLNLIWPFRTGRSVRSFEFGVGRIPEANNPPGPRPRFTVEEAESRLAGVRPGQKVYVANEARLPKAKSSYAQGLWVGAFSPQLPRPGAGPILESYLRSVEKEVASQAEDRAIAKVFK